MKRMLLAIMLIAITKSLVASMDATREILLNNDAVEMVRLTYPPGTESGFHTHTAPHRTVYVVKGGQLELIPKDAIKGKIIEAKTGTAMYLPAATHNVRNTGMTDIILIETELKKSSNEN